MTLMELQIDALISKVAELELRLVKVEDQIRTRLKEEAEDAMRQGWINTWTGQRDITPDDLR